MIETKIFTEKKSFSSIAKIWFGVLLISIMAQISIPINPVPITLHTVAIMLIALYFSSLEAFFTMLSYILIGLVGIPVFTGFTSGFAKILGPSGGYFLGMLVSVTFVSFIREYYGFSPKSTIHNVFLMVILLIILYFFGILRLSNFIGLEKAIYAGFIVFIPSGIAKTIILSLIVSYINGKTS
ncbi:MAG: biotin transporter BioY [Rickettsiaceae bacterium]|nr:biotin transporter BioY [Rickettsiaceae bacterium]